MLCCVRVHMKFYALCARSIYIAHARVFINTRARAQLSNDITS